MCGIVAQIIKGSYGFTKKSEETFFDMLYADTLRGDDSTGMICVQKDSSFGIIKEALAAPYVVDGWRTETMVKDMFSKGKAYIGHNRKATVGKITGATAHPFVVDNSFAMVHNGTLYSHNELAKTEVDSEALAIHLQKILNDDVTKEILDEEMGKVRGAYAIIAYNQKNHKIYAMRNRERPLTMVTHDDGWTLSSEAGLSLWCLGRQGISLKDAKTEFLKEDVLYTFDLESNTVTQLEFVPKKAFTQTYTTSGVVASTVRRILGTKPTNTSITDFGISKSEFKRVRRKMLATLIDFYADDYVEKDFPRTIADGAHVINIMGECDKIAFENNVQGVFDIHDFPAGENRITGRLFQGRIYEMMYNRETQSVVIYVNDVKAYPLSTKKNENTPTVH